MEHELYTKPSKNLFSFQNSVQNQAGLLESQRRMLNHSDIVKSKIKGEGNKGAIQAGSQTQIKKNHIFLSRQPSKNKIKKLNNQNSIILIRNNPHQKKSSSHIRITQKTKIRKKPHKKNPNVNLYRKETKMKKFQQKANKIFKQKVYNPKPSKISKNFVFKAFKPLLDPKNPKNVRIHNKKNNITASFVNLKTPKQGRIGKKGTGLSKRKTKKVVKFSAKQREGGRTQTCRIYTEPNRFCLVAAKREGVRQNFN